MLKKSGGNKKKTYSNQYHGKLLKNKRKFADPKKGDKS